MSTKPNDGATALRLSKTDKHNRTLLAHASEPLEIQINYTGEGNVAKALILDGEVIPSILQAVNQHDSLKSVAEAHAALLSHLDTTRDKEAQAKLREVQS